MFLKGSLHSNLHSVKLHALYCDVDGINFKRGAIVINYATLSKYTDTLNPQYTYLTYDQQ